MRLGFPNGNSSTDTFDTAEKVEGWFQAGEAIAVGVGTMIDIGGAATAGRKVLTVTTGDDHCINGIFEGDGFPTGAKSTTTGLGKGPNRAAVTSDIILVTLYGPAVAILDTQTAASAGDNLYVSTATNGYLGRTSDVAAGNAAPVILLGTATNATTASAAGTATASVWCHLL